MPGGYWKATRLIEGEYALISEVVMPGFEYSDMALSTEEEIKSLVPENMWDEVKLLVKNQPTLDNTP